MFARSDRLGADRVDPRTGVRERAAFSAVGTGGEQMLLFSYEPAGDPIGVVLICPSILGDFLANYRREVNLARCLASFGMAVARFHYRGTGNSGGDPAQLTLSSMDTDTRWAARELVGRHPGLPIGFVGTRWGALSVAAAAAHDYPRAPMVLCEPVTDFSRFYSDGMRSRAFSALATGKTSQPARQISDLLMRDGCADIVGNVVHPALYDSTVGVEPGQILTTGSSHSSLLVQFKGTDLRPANRKLVKQFAAARMHVETTIIDIAESWWFRPQAPHLVPVAHAFNDAVRTWLQSELPASARLEQG